jgi:DNA polymerase-1
MSLSDVKLHLIDDLDTANDMMSWLGERRLDDLAIDTETSGLSPEHDVVRLVQIGDSMTGWAIPWQRWGGVFLEAMKKYDDRITMHNAKFDVGMLRDTCAWQTPTHRLDDTMLMAHIIDPNGSIGLKPLCSRYVDRAASGLQGRLDQVLSDGKAKQGWTWGTVPIDYEPYWTYAALDTVLTARLRNILYPKLVETSTLKAYELEVQASLVCERMERNGITVDRQYAQASLTQFRDHSKMLSDWCKEHYNVRPSQNASVAQRLVADGMPLDKTTESGAIALDKAVLGPIADLHPLAHAVLEHRRYSKLASTYIRHFVDKTSDEDPRLRPQIWSVGTKTGRMSMSQPNLQNLPRRSESNPAAITVRNCLVSGPGRVLLMIDYDQIELRFIAHLAGDEGLKLAFTADPDVDVFTAAARELFQTPDLSRKDARRQYTKNAFYAMGYGAGADKFSVTAGLSPEEGHDIYNRIAMRYPGMKGLGRSVEQRARQRLADEGTAYAKSPLTGRRHPADDGVYYTLVNYVAQGAAAELLKMKLIELDAAGFGPYLCLPVHDEVVFDVPEDQVREFAQAACDVMKDDNLISVPITVGPSIGHRWGSKEDYEL